METNTLQAKDIRTQLRVGNNVLFKGRIKIVYQIRESGCDFHIGGKCYQSWLWSAINPIPLGEDILFKLGFIRDGNEFKKGLWKLIPDYPKKEIIGYGLMSKRLEWIRLNETSIHYVHQLQNVFHSLTGEELTIKE